MTGRPRQIGARLMAAVMGIGQVTVGGIYGGPEELVRRPLQPGQMSAVVWIESWGPVWILLFVIVGVILAAAAAMGRGFIRAHVTAAGVWGLYAGCILFSALLTEPPVPVVAGTVAGIVSLINIAIARTDAEMGCR